LTFPILGGSLQSQVSVLYRNNAANFDQNINKDFGKNVANLLNNEALSHTLSISVRYFIDYKLKKQNLGVLILKRHIL
jgi:hypothetical protein